MTRAPQSPIAHGGTIDAAEPLEAVFAPARDKVVDTCRALLERGYLKATEGNVSVRVAARRAGDAAFAVTPSNYGYEHIRPEDIAILDVSGRVVDAPMKPSVEAGMHAAVYRLRPDVRAIIHTHQPYASALALIRERIPALYDEQVRFLGREVAIVDYAPSGTPFLAKNVAKQLGGGANAFILANHGVLVFGADAERAVFNMALLEKVSLTYLLALMTREKVARIPAPIREIAFAQLRADEKRVAAQVAAAAPLLEGDRLPAAAAARRAAIVAGGTTYGEPLASLVESRTGPYDGSPAAPSPTEPTDVTKPTSPATSLPAEITESTEPGWAISTYPDVDDVYRRLDALLAQPLRPLRREAMLGYLDYFETHCRASKEITERATRRIPGGVQHNLAFNHPFPLAIERAEGAYLWDRDGNRYIDFLQAGAPTILGSNYAPVRERVTELLAHCGPVTGLFHEAELLLAESVHRYMPGVEMLRSLGSGTESVMAAVRGARAFTGKTWVIKVGGAYHGWSDTMVYSLRVPGTKRMNAKGIPLGATSATQELFPHDLRALRRRLIANRVLGGTAAVILEPLGPESGTRPVPHGFNAEVRELCDEFGALLIFDEVVTGFRVGMGGAQGYFGVRPDLTVFGKAIAGGYPMAGAVGGRADVMSVFGAGLGGKNGAHVQVGGTLSANPLSCLAGHVAIEEMARTGAPVIAGRAGDRLTAGLNRIIDRYGLPYVAFNQGSIVHLETSAVMLLDMRHPLKLFRENKPRKQLIEEMGAAYTAEGIITLAGSRMYTSMADTDEVIDEALAGFERVLSQAEGL